MPKLMGHLLIIVTLFVAFGAPRSADAEKSRQTKRVKTKSAKVATVTPAQVYVDFVSTTGGLDKKAARRAVEKQLTDLRACYERRMKTAAAVGQMDFRLLVGGKGKVVSATVEHESVGDEELEKCARREAMDLRFPTWKTGKHATVRYSLVFTSGGLLSILNSPSGLGLGGLLLKGSGGGGAGSGTIGLGKVPSGVISPWKASPGAPPAPRITQGTATVRGSLSKEVISRYIRRHINQIRYCYEQQLVRNPNLAGRVSIRFVISPSGSVSTAAVAGSTLGNPSAEQCVARAIQRIAFPQPQGGGVVIVTYPFLFQSSSP
jgi:TonB family protein